MNVPKPESHYPHLVPVLETITPEMAREYLSNQVNGQRSLSHGRVARYADDMKNGFWEPTHQGIALDSEGRLVDGQHRLHAVVLSDTPVRMLVFRGLPIEHFYLVDGGYSRNAQSFLTGPHGGLRAVLSRTMLALTENYGKVDSGTTHKNYPSHRVLNFLESRQDVREYGEEFAVLASRLTVRRAFSGSSAGGLMVGGFIAGFDGKLWDPSKSREWWDHIHSLTTGEGVPDGSPLRALYVCAPSGATAICVARSVYAARKFREGDELRSIRTCSLVKLRAW